MLARYAVIITCLAVSHFLSACAGYRIGLVPDNEKIAVGIVLLLTVAWIPVFLHYGSGLRNKLGMSIFNGLAMLLWVQAGFALNQPEAIGIVLYGLLALFGSGVMLAFVMDRHGDLNPTIKQLLDI